MTVFDVITESPPRHHDDCISIL